MVEILENTKKLVIKLSEHMGFVSEYAEWVSKEVNVNIKKLSTKFDRYPFPLFCEETYEIEPTNDNSMIEITIRDDNQNSDSYHYDYMYFKFRNGKWESEYKPNPFHH
jgi:hypothetical protein